MSRTPLPFAFVAAASVAFAAACGEDRALVGDDALHLLGHQAPTEGCSWAAEEPAEFISRGTLDLGVAESSYMLAARVKTATGQARPVVLRRAAVDPTPAPGFSAGAEAFPPFETVVAGSVEPGTALVVLVPLFSKEQIATLQDWLPERSPEEPAPSTEFAVEVQLFGEELNGRDTRSNVFDFPLVVCRGCLLRFPPDAAGDGPPNCRNVDEVASLDPPCVVGG